MKWISDKVDAKSMLVASIGLTGFSVLIKSIIEVVRYLIRWNFNSWIIDITRGDILTLASIIIGVLLIFYKMYVTPESKNQAEENRKQLFYKMVMLLMLLASMLSYSKKVFLVVLFSMSALNMFLLGLIIIMFYYRLKKKL